jgi:hypothetical protein
MTHNALKNEKNYVKIKNCQKCKIKSIRMRTLQDKQS